MHLYKQAEASPLGWQPEDSMGVMEFIIIFTNPSSLAGYDTRSIFKRILTGLISEFSFS